MRGLGDFAENEPKNRLFSFTPIVKDALFSLCFRAPGSFILWGNFDPLEYFNFQ